MKRLIALIALGASAFGSVAEAQQAGLDGVWNCQMSYTETDRRGKRLSGFTQEFQMQLSPNGQFFAQGMMNAVPYPTQFQAQGQWGVDGGILGAQGMSMGPFGQTQWGLRRRGQRQYADDRLQVPQSKRHPDNLAHTRAVHPLDQRLPKACDSLLKAMA